MTPATTSPTQSHQQSWKGIWLWYVALAAIAIISWLPNGYFKMVGWPWALLWQLGFLACGSLLVWMLRQFDIPFRLLGYGFDWAVAFMGAGLILSSLLSEFPLVGLWNTLLVAGYLLLLYGSVNLVRQSYLTLAHLWKGCGVFVSVTALVSLAFWRPEAGMWQTSNFDDALRNPRPFGHHNFVGGFFALTLPLVVSLALALRGKQRWLAILSTALVAGALYVSGSRGATLGFLAWLVVALAAVVLAPNVKHRGRRLGIAAVALGIGLIGFISNPRVRDIGGELIASIQDPSVPIGIQDNPTLERAHMIGMGLAMLKRHPLLGIGPGTMSRISNLYQPIDFTTGLDHVQQLHNTPAQLIGELGLFGLALYLIWLAFTLRLIWQIYRVKPQPPYLLLLYGLVGSAFAYGVASLTDYQFEVVPIATLLTLMLVMLIALADQTLENPIPEMKRRHRRIGSLLLLGLIALMIRFWSLADGSYYLAYRGIQNAQAGDIALSSDQWQKAALITPWDPTYDALAGQQLYSLLPEASDETRLPIKEEAILRFQQATQNAPNDAWFNQNLAILTRELDPAMAEQYARRSLQLLPRSNNFAFYLLGQTLLDQGNQEQAIQAFAIESLVNPELLIMPLWQEAPFSTIWDPVLDRSLALHDQLLADIPPSSPNYAAFYNQSTLVRWWHDLPLIAANQDKLYPFTQALIASDSDIEAALSMVNQALATAPDDKALLLLRAWLAPERYADDYFASQNTTPEEAAAAKQHLLTHRDARDWIRSLPSEKTPQKRAMLGFAYRNWYAQSIQLIAQPEGLQSYLVLEILEFFPDLSGNFPELNYLVNDLRTTELQLPSPRYNDLQITPLPAVTTVN
jgi:putative inorganic carbon (HCO3(-)) transporter